MTDYPSLPPEGSTKSMRIFKYCLAGFLALIVYSFFLKLLPSKAVDRHSQNAERTLPSSETSAPRKEDVQLPIAEVPKTLDILEQVQSSLTIDRTWVQDLSDRQWAKALVTWENTTSQTFNKEVRIQAVAFDTSGQRINENMRSFFVSERGPISPGFKGTLTIPVELHNQTFSTMECAVIVAR